MSASQNHLLNVTKFIIKKRKSYEIYKKNIDIMVTGPYIKDISNAR